MLIYSNQITPRIEYIMKVMIGDLLRSPFRITDDIVEYQNYTGIKFAYSNDDIPGICFPASSILFEDDIKKQDLTPVEWKQLKLFFPVKENLYFPFDPFAVSFYLVTRYEEYLSDLRKDEHNRFDVRNSVSYKNGFHRKPLVNMLAYELAAVIRSAFPEFSYTKQSFSIIPTYDVDIAYRYKGKGFANFLAALAKSILQFDFKKAGKLIRARARQDFDDPYDTFGVHKELAGTYKHKPVHFILTSSFGKYDRNIHHKTPVFTELIQELASFSDIGLHPSYNSWNDSKLIDKEKTRLETVGGNKITKSRQHFLRFSFPDTFNYLIENGIQEDYSLGWTNEAGFRASISSPFRFFDLVENKEKDLLLHPLIIMDTALYHELKCDRQDCMDIFRELRKEVEYYGGEMIVLWHNYTMPKNSEALDLYKETYKILFGASGE